MLSAAVLGIAALGVALLDVAGGIAGLDVAGLAVVVGVPGASPAAPLGVAAVFGTTPSPPMAKPSTALGLTDDTGADPAADGGIESWRPGGAPVEVAPSAVFDADDECVFGACASGLPDAHALTHATTTSASAVRAAS